MKRIALIVALAGGLSACTTPSNRIHTASANTTNQCSTYADSKADLGFSAGNVNTSPFLCRR